MWSEDKDKDKDLWSEDKDKDKDLQTDPREQGLSSRTVKVSIKLEFYNEKWLTY